jgi:GNAT superfamily N-acetyltransferase
VSVWTSQALSEHHDLTRLRSGHDTLDHWLHHEAQRAHTAGTAHTTVWTPHEDPVVVAYYAIAPTQFARADLPSRALSAGYSHVPGYLIARLALDRSLHRQGLGTQLLLDALERIVIAAADAGGRLIAVDAIDGDAHRFYRLVMKVATARSALSL